MKKSDLSDRQGKLGVFGRIKEGIGSLMDKYGDHMAKEPERRKARIKLLKEQVKEQKLKNQLGNLKSKGKKPGNILDEALKL